MSVFVRLLTTKAVAGGGVACKPGNACSFFVVENFGDSKKLVTNCVPSGGRVPRSRLWLGASSSLSFAAVALHFSLPSRDQRNSGYLQDRKKFGRFAEVNEFLQYCRKDMATKLDHFRVKQRLNRNIETTKDKSTSQTHATLKCMYILYSSN